MKVVPLRLVPGDDPQPLWRLNLVSINDFAFVTLTITGDGDIYSKTALAEMISSSLGQLTADSAAKPVRDMETKYVRR